MASIPQRELRNNVSEVLRRAESGERLTITVAGRPVAEFGPASSQADFATADELRRIIASAPADGGWAGDLARQRDEERAAATDPWA